MKKKPRASRYDVTGNVEAEYADEAHLVLVNKCGITNLAALQIAEEKSLAAAYERLLREVKVDTPITNELLRYIHSVIFGDLFAWAGRWRRVNIAKPGAIWPTAAFLEQSMTQFERNVLARYPASSLESDAQFVSAVAEIQGEFLAVHPFREGNARTIKLATDLLAAQTGRALLVYDATDAAAEAYIAAAAAALHRGDCDPLKRLISEALDRAR